MSLTYLLIVEIGYPYYVLPPVLNAAVTKKQKDMLNKQLDNVNNSKHELNLYKQVLNTVEDDIKLIGPEPAPDQEYIVHDFRNLGLSQIYSKFNENKNEELSIESISIPIAKVTKFMHKSKVCKISANFCRHYT